MKSRSATVLRAPAGGWLSRSSARMYAKPTMHTTRTSAPHAVATHLIQRPIFVSPLCDGNTLAGTHQTNVNQNP